MLIAISHGIVLREHAAIAELVNSQNNVNAPSSNYNRKRLLIGRHCFVADEEVIDFDLTSRAMPDLKRIMTMHHFDCPGGLINGRIDLNVGAMLLSCNCDPYMDRDFEHWLNKHIHVSIKRVQIRSAKKAIVGVIEQSNG